MSHTSEYQMSAATHVFNIPEILELILLSLPRDTIHTEIASMRTILTSRTTSRTWNSLLNDSTPLRHLLYLPSPLDTMEAKAWREQSRFPPARPNPWTPHLLLNQRSWGSAYPFDTTHSAIFSDGPPPVMFWTFTLELSRAQYTRLPPPGTWRELLATSPPFHAMWYTRSFYELGSGRAPFVTHIDYKAKLPKSEQKYSLHCPLGVTLGHIVDAMAELFEKHPAAKFVMVESVRPNALRETDAGELPNDATPTTRSYMPGSSAERSHGWQRGQW